MQNVPANTDSEVYANVERSIGLTIKPTDGPFQPLEYFKEKAGQSSPDTRKLDFLFMQDSGFPALIIGDSENEKNIAGYESSICTRALSKNAEVSANDEVEYCAQSDGPRNRIDQRLDGEVQVHVPAEVGNAHQIVELIENDTFQDAENNLTPAAIAAIRAAVTNLSFFQTYEGRAQQVQDHVNMFGSGIILRIDRDRINENTINGSQPAIILRIPDLNKPEDRKRDAIHRIPLNP